MARKQNSFDEDKIARFQKEGRGEGTRRTARDRTSGERAADNPAAVQTTSESSSASAGRQLGNLERACANRIALFSANGRLSDGSQIYISSTTGSPVLLRTRSTRP